MKCDLVTIDGFSDRNTKVRFDETIVTKPNGVTCLVSLYKRKLKSLKIVCSKFPSTVLFIRPIHSLLELGISHARLWHKYRKSSVIGMTEF